MQKQLLTSLLGVALLCTSNLKAQNWLLGGQNVPAPGGILGSNNNRPVIFETNNIERGRIQNSTGFWGFGVNAPSAQVHINTTATGINPLRVEISNTPAMVVNSEGKIGIGTSGPSSKLEVDARAGEEAFKVQIGGIQKFLVRSNGGVSIGNGATPPVDGLHVAGNTGIGTISPSVKLHAVGGTDAAPDGGGFIVNGSLSGTNLVIDDNEIMARNNGVVSSLTLNNNGGDVIIDGTNSGSRLGLGTFAPVTDVHFIHGVGSGATNGLRLKTDGANEDWTFYVQSSNGAMELYANNAFMGVFDDVSGTYSSVSDLRRKKDIEKSPDLMNKILQLDVKKYHFLESKSSDKKHYGLIAQEVEKIFPEVVSHHKGDNGDEYYTIDYNSFGVLAIKAIQEQQNKITSLEERLAKLETAIAANTVSSAVGKNIKGGISNIVLEQNQPNPFNQTATIRYKIPQDAKAQISIHDAAGKPVKTLPATKTGQVQLNASDLKAGIYAYTLTVNGKAVASKKMMIAK